MTATNAALDVTADDANLAKDKGHQKARCSKGRDMKTLTLAAAFAAFAAPSFAQDTTALQGDAAKGEEQFNRQCIACHVVQDPATDEVLAGRNAKVGPNLYGVAGAVPGHIEDFAYGDSLKVYGATGAVWDEANFVGYIQNPTGFLRTALDDKRARGKMAYQVRKEDEAYDMYAFLATFGDQAAASQ